MRNKSIITEAKQIHLATELITLGARLQVLEMNTNLSRERLVKLYKEIRGVSPPKGMLPYSEDWFMSWQPNMHSSLFINIYNYVITNTGETGIEALIKSYRLYMEHIKVNEQDKVLSLTRAWTLIRFIDSGVLCIAPCVSCHGKYVVHSLEIHSNHVCGLCNIPSRAGKTKKAAMLAAAAH
ncbi:MAG TPA: flagellar transcriptional regulator FlhC [Nitrosomonas sp.]|nr:flagellar transcriptional regulator FlhC [Nitrosomonas sp.]HQX13261.1 flagellar transcriptional regulator FlhC [Nitrosomonas sp.]HRB21046.1 flagellar transcriptional regulator FlhC [Nitrosomonas sp.]HRB32017.1 flagellar transcriptional regulator FlhC [Nitrosomonas sp.]HRB45534.1 flagellar transcriptional regulator FlhC [Nitrosomonas sp.]